MQNSRHIFLQIDTEGLIAAMGPANTPTNAQVRQYTLIGDQGSLAMGNQVENFEIGIEEVEDLHFSILPLKIFSYHMLYFTDFKVIKQEKINIPPSMPQDGRTLSFKVSVTGGEVGGFAEFNLYANMEFQNASGDTIIVPICIDPMLRIKQGRKP